MDIKVYFNKVLIEKELVQNKLQNQGTERSVRWRPSVIKIALCGSVGTFRSVGKGSNQRF